MLELRVCNRGHEGLVKSDQTFCRHARFPEIGQGPRATAEFQQHFNYMSMDIYPVTKREAENFLPSTFM